MEPLFGEAQFLLGSHATDDGEYAVAIERLGAAVKAKPRNASYWNALAYAQAKAGQREDAKTSARAAVRTAQTEEQERMAQSLLESLN